MEKKQLLNKTTTVLLGFGIITAILAICFFVFHVPDFWSQLLAIIASAFLGAGATAWITNTLLKNQQESEEAKEKNIKVYENKIQVYSEFISKLWKTIEDDVITDEEIRGIRSDIFNKLIFYLKKEEIISLCGMVKRIESTEQDETDDSQKTKNAINCFSEITELLRKSVNENSNSTSKEISEIWNGFTVQPRSTYKERVSVPTPTGIAPTACPTENLTFNHGFWHFNMFGDAQIDAFRRNLFELSLMEYGETWRTNLVEQVKTDDIVFLFKRGGSGYIGAFIVKGWRVIINDENGFIEKICINDNKKEISDKDQIDADIKNYDFYGAIEDGASSCANIIVEPIAFDYRGVSYPGGVYRRTISRYDFGYAKTLLSRFLTNKGKNSDENEGYSINVNTKEFEKIVNELHITISEKDEKGNWI